MLVNSRVFGVFFAVFLFSASPTVAQLPEQLTLDFSDSADVFISEWLFVAPTPLGVTAADPSTTLSVEENAWNWSIANANEVLVGVYGIPLTDSSIRTTLEHDATSGASLGFLNRFGATPNPADPSMPFGHGYCVLISSKTATLIDFDFARNPEDYIRVIDQVGMPDDLFTGESTEAFFQTIDGPSLSDSAMIVPKFDFAFGGVQLFSGVEDANASWSRGFAGVDVWSVDPFAELTSPMLKVRYDNITIRGIAVPEPSSIWLCGVTTICYAIGRRRSRSRTRLIRLNAEARVCYQGADPKASSCAKQC